MDVEVTTTYSVQKKALEGSPSAFDTKGGARLRPGKPEDGSVKLAGHDV